MDGDVIALFENFVDILNDLGIRRKSSLNALRKERIISDYLHAESFSSLRNLKADCSESDNTERFAHDLGTRKLRFALFNKLADIVALAFQTLAPIISGCNLSRSEKKSADNKLLNCIGVCAGSVKNNDALLCALVNRNVIRSCAGTGDRNSFGRKLSLVH